MRSSYSSVACRIEQAVCNPWYRRRVCGRRRRVSIGQPDIQMNDAPDFALTSSTATIIAREIDAVLEPTNDESFNRMTFARCWEWSVRNRAA